VTFDFAHLFSTSRSHEEAFAKADVTFEHTSRLNESVAEMFFALGLRANFGAKQTTAREHYCEHIKSRLEWLTRGDDFVLTQIIERWSEVSPGRFAIDIHKEVAREGIEKGLRARLELAEEVISKVAPYVPATSPRIDIRKELDLLQAYLIQRQKTTGETSLHFTTREIPFRHAIAIYENGAALPSIGTCGPSERVLLPLLLEASGVLDITYMGVCSSPDVPDDIEVKYAVRFPSRDSLYGVEHRGLRTDDRRKMSEVELSLFDRTYRELQHRYVFVGRPQLEKSFADIASWLLRKVAYSLEEPSFLSRPAREWLINHAEDKYKKMEDDFFLPFLRERLHNEFGLRVKQKPEAFAGEVDLLFDQIPLELKVRRGNSTPLHEVIGAAYPPASQAAAYAAHTRLALVAVLDLPEGEPSITNLDSCVVRVERVVEGDFPTCVVVFIFHCHHPVPSTFTDA
jgi:hypothetical protein